MIHLSIGKTGWRVIGDAVEGGWGQTLRLALVIVTLATLVPSVLVCAGVAGSWLAQSANSIF